MVNLLGRFFLTLLLLVSLAACSASHNELLPIPADLKGANRLGSVELVVRPAASASIAAFGDQPGVQSAGGVAALVTRELARSFASAGLVSGRAVDVTVDIDEFEVARPGAALVGRDDRLSALVLLRGAGDGAPLGQLRVRVDRANGGLVSVAARIGGGTGEALVRQMADEVAEALAR